LVGLLFIAALAVSACSTDQQTETPDDEEATIASIGELTPLSLPELQPVELNGERLRVAATTSLIGDVVSQVGGEAIELTTLMEAGQDPHSYEPAAGDLAAVAKSQIIFVNGWNLEEGLLDDLVNVSEGAPMVPVAAGIEPRIFESPELEQEDEKQAAVDPHTWLDPQNVLAWVDNVELTLVTMDPENAETYAVSADQYRQALHGLIESYDDQVATIPVEGRKLVTNHDSLGYLAQAYDFEIIGTVIPAASTLTEPSARNLARLLETMQEAGVCTLFAESTANVQLAQTVAGELDGCQQVQVITLFTGALGPAGSGADSYLGMMQANIEALADGLQVD
jgi:ABC-type Zn uptake system ZnuABC Zn-binding protein ZnuA